MTQIRAWKKVLESDLSNIAIELKEVLHIPCVLIMDGDVGAGKTTFTKVFIGKNEVQSPTYSLINEYDNILHADLYRLEKKEDIVHLEISMYIEEKDYFIVEWGMEHRYSLHKILGDEFKFYQLKIEVNESNGSTPSRNFLLNTISF